MDPSPSQPQSTLSACLEETKLWVKHNFLHLNCAKTEAIEIGTQHQTQRSTINPNLAFQSHIDHVRKSTFFSLQNIAKI